MPKKKGQSRSEKKQEERLLRIRKERYLNFYRRRSFTLPSRSALRKLLSAREAARTRKFRETLALMEEPPGHKSQSKEECILEWGARGGKKRKALDQPPSPEVKQIKKKKKKKKQQLKVEEEENDEVDEKDWLQMITLHLKQDEESPHFPAPVQAQGTGIELVWPEERPISPRAQARVRKVLETHTVGHWGQISALPLLSQAANKLVEEGVMNLSQISSYHSWLRTERATRVHHQIKGQARNLLDLYNSGHSVLSISAKYDFPPMAIFRTILTKRGINPKTALSKPAQYLSQRDLVELSKARSSDLATSDVQTHQLENAEKFEQQIAKFLKARSIRYKLQQHLQEEQSHFFERAFSTPDFLLLDDVYIKGQIVRWIDAKNYYCSSDVKSRLSSLKKQASRYNEYWGPGALAFSLNYCSELDLGTPVVLLDASFLVPDLH